MWFNGYGVGVPLGTRARLFIPKLNTRRLWNEGGESESLRPIDNSV